uniref:CUB domain-containing protein n=1 Tax=Macrostomum lignano TaxID=282301 RepID=A0A1I8GV67_9PLAT
MAKRHFCGVGVEDDAIALTGYSNLLRLLTLDSLVTDQIETTTKNSAAYSTTTSTGSCESLLDVYFTTYYVFPIRKGCALPLFNQKDSQLEVRFDASSSNYRRHANYSVVGATLAYEG